MVLTRAQREILLRSDRAEFTVERLQAALEEIVRAEAPPAPVDVACSRIRSPLLLAERAGRADG